MATSQQKINISLNSSILFFLLNSTYSFNFLSKVLNLNLIEDNCPNNNGVIITTILFFIITYLSMGDPFKKQLFKLPAQN